MQFLTLVVFLSVTGGTFLADSHLAPSPLRYLPEFLSLCVLSYVLVAGSSQRFRFVPARYWIAFIGILVVIGCGVVSNGSQPGILIGGLRFYLRAAPMFFVPAVINFSEAQLRTQLRLLLAVALLQLPVSLYQRYELYLHDRWTGDPVFGTLMISSIMSVFLIGCICIAAAMMLRDRISKKTFLLLFVIFVVPTTINETKATLFLLPIGLVATLLVGSPPQRRMRIGASAIALIAIFGALYIPIYNYFASINNPYPYTVASFFSNQKLVNKYLDKQTDVGSTGEVGRVDALVVPLREFSSDPVRLMFGVGVGNGSVSTLGEGYTGEYFHLLGRFVDQSSGGAFIVEIGVLGLALVLLLYWFVFWDSLYVALRDPSIVGPVALGWVGVTLVVVIGTFYKNLHTFESLSYLFWYYSGMIAAQRMRLETEPRPVSVGYPASTLQLERPGLSRRQMRFLP